MFASSAPDKFLPSYGVWSEPKLTRAASPRITLSESTAVGIFIGQSNFANAVNATLAATNAAKIDCFNVVDGGTYPGTEPLLGCSPGNLGNMALHVADQCISAGIWQRFIMVPIALSGTTFAQWGSGQWAPILPNAIRRLASVGLTPTLIMQQHGESDNIAGTSQADCQLYMGQMIAQARALGVNAPWLIAKCSYIAGATNANVRNAQAAMVNPAAQIYAGPDTDTLTGTAVNRQGDDTHFTLTGAAAAGGLWKNSIDLVF